MTVTCEQGNVSRLPWGWVGRLVNPPLRFSLLALLTALVVAVYALANHTLGFPLDDAWIHQDFARTLVQYGRFAFAPGRSGAGSTSPLWVLLLTPAQAVPGAPLWLVVVWADVLGALALFGLAWATSALVEFWLMDGDARFRALATFIIGCTMLVEWHLTWAALSGMETLLFIFLSVLLLVGVGRGWHPAWLGALSGLLTMTRPEGSVLALLIVIFFLLRSDRPQLRAARWRGVLLYLAVYVLGVLPLVLLNELAFGHLLPSTFYAKGMYYALGSSELERLAGYAWGVLRFLGSSPLVVLGLPGVGYLLWRTRHDWRRGTIWLGVAWVFGLIGIYAVHLPVVYHNGRYLMPVLPLLLAWGVVGWVRLVEARKYALLSGALLLLTMGLGVLSVVRGASIYAANVRYINEYQVATARWLRDHTQADAIVATHDIGAIGYFSGRQVIDLGGLTQPEIVPLLGDQRALVAYLKQQRVDYVVMFPDWFPPPRLLLAAVQHGEVYHTHDPAIAAIGGSDLVTYQTGWSGHSTAPVPAPQSQSYKRLMSCSDRVRAYCC